MLIHTHTHTHTHTQVRKDRHVPLHFGGLSYSKDPADAQFVSLFDTHGPRAGVFDQVHANFPCSLVEK